jgi:hypothetical protein
VESQAEKKAALATLRAIHRLAAPLDGVVAPLGWIVAPLGQIVASLDQIVAPLGWTSDPVGHCAEKCDCARPQTPLRLKSQINARLAEIDRRDIGDMGYVFANDSRTMAGSDERCLEEGRELYRVFHNSPERRIIRLRCDRMMPRVLVDLGALRGLIYSADRDGCGRVKTFIHFMETPPRLMCDPQGNQLYVIGGRYRITRRGIEG